jgi:hypothetical protein
MSTRATNLCHSLYSADTLTLFGRLHSSPFTAGTGTNHEHIKMFFWRSLHGRSHSKTVDEYSQIKANRQHKGLSGQAPGDTGHHQHVVTILR